MSEFRLLTREELESVPGMQEPIPGSLWAMGLVDNDGVAAACGVFWVVHADPIWIRPDKRNNGKLLLRLWEKTRDEILFRNMGREVFVGMTDTNPGQPTEGLVERMVQKAGGMEVYARFFIIPVEEQADGLH
jgi:hypothetical protein